MKKISHRSQKNKAITTKKAIEIVKALSWLDFEEVEQGLSIVGEIQKAVDDPMIFNFKSLQEVTKVNDNELIVGIELDTGDTATYEFKKDGSHFYLNNHKISK